MPKRPQRPGQVGLGLILAPFLVVLGQVWSVLKPPQRPEQVRLGSILAPFMLVLGTGLERSQTSTVFVAGSFGVDFGSFFARSGDRFQAYPNLNLVRIRSVRGRFLLCC